MRPAVALVALSLAMPSFAFAQATTSPSAAPSSRTTTGSGTSSTMTPSERDAQSALEREGYTQIRDIKSTSDGVSGKAMKDGQEVSVSVDSSGKVKRR
ncbi:MAG: PepSY domain-containing protein [Alphaproteobacteria bacterium]|nr:PepSY domain-containing protein [Alphaproteobacteria bacterium]